MSKDVSPQLVGDGPYVTMKCVDPMDPNGADFGDFRRRVTIQRYSLFHHAVGVVISALIYVITPMGDKFCGKKE